ncbi:MAG: lasso peptide biosynthesis PqqD family chaperone [Calothrix sp. MO_167.B12]|nr:lasso peptide biosynthesis PqqD family chaperone [Calothrix sp. MO_167.B12]
MVKNEAVIVAAKEQISSDLAGESVILQLSTGIYYGLNQVGASIWNLIQESKTVEEIKNAILEEYEVEPEQCDRDLLALLQELEAKGLIEVKNEVVV